VRERGHEAHGEADPDDAGQDDARGDRGEAGERGREGGFGRRSGHVDGHGLAIGNRARRLETAVPSPRLWTN
jgi:hypothetical protein